MVALGTFCVDCSRPTPTKLEDSAQPTEYSVVWGDTPLGVRSYLLEFSRGQLRIAGEASGAWFLVGGQPYRWHQLEETRQILNECPEPNAESDDSEGADAAQPGTHTDVTVVGAEAERLDASGRVTISSPPSVEGATVFSNTIQLRASAGPHLFIERFSDAMYCGAVHGSPSFSFDTFDLANQKFVPVPTKAELTELATLVQKTRRDSLLECVGSRTRPDGQKLGVEELSELEPWRAVPVLSASNQLDFEVTLGMLRFYAEGVISCPVTITKFATSLTRFAPPPGLDAFKKLQPKTEIHGWSSLAANERARFPAIERIFAEEARDAKKSN